MAVSRRLRFEILRRDGHTCRYCGGRAPDVALTVDHVIPTTLGGSDDPSNLVAACADCNAGKSSVPAGAELVADVAADALRWRAAIMQASIEFEAEREFVDSLLDDFERTWNGWSYPVTITEPVTVEPTGDVLVDNWHAVMGWDAKHSEPVHAEGDTLTVRVKRGYTDSVRSEAVKTLGTWARLTGLPLTSVVITQGQVNPPPAPPPPIKREERRTIPLDPNWRDSVARFLSQGLTSFDLERLLEVAMRRPNISKDERFRYFCGCAWREITNLQESARRIIESETEG